MALDHKSILWSGRYDGSYEAATCLGKPQDATANDPQSGREIQSFVYGRVRLVSQRTGPPTIEVELRARANGRAICSGCGRKGPGYDRLPLRRFEFVTLWGMVVFFLYALRRVDCPRCGVTAEAVPWCQGKQ